MQEEAGKVCPLERVKDGKGFVGCVCVEEKECQQQKEVHHSWCPMTSGRLEEQTFVHFPELQFHPYSKGSRQQMHILNEALIEP